MAVTRLIRKTKRRRAAAGRRQLNLKLQSFMPVIKKVDAEELKAQFKGASSSKKKAAKADDTSAEPQAE